jgi:hypothetical protein
MFDEKMSLSLVNDDDDDDDNDNLYNTHKCYTGTIGQVSYKQPNTTCQQLLKMYKTIHKTLL